MLPIVLWSCVCLWPYANRRLRIRGQFQRKPGRRYLLASAGILATPKWREIAGAFAFGSGAQGGDGGGGQGKRRRFTADRAELLHHVVHDSSGGPAREKVGERGAARGLALKRCAMHCARHGFRAKHV